MTKLSFVPGHLMPPSTLCERLVLQMRSAKTSYRRLPNLPSPGYSHAAGYSTPSRSIRRQLLRHSTSRWFQQGRHCCAFACRVERLFCRVARRPRADGLRGHCANMAFPRTRVCQHSKPGSPPARASDQAWQSSRHRPTYRPEQSANG